MISPSDILHGNILIVDDQPVNILLLDQILQRAGYVCVTSTTDPSQVYDLHLHNHYDLILLDLQMPVMNGFQVMDALKKIELDGYLPVLIITAQPDHKLRALQAGAKDFISKPFELADVLARVRNMLEVRLLHKESHHYNTLLKRKVQEQATLLNISYTLALTLELQPALILDQLHEIIAYSRGALFILDGATLVSQALRNDNDTGLAAPLILDVPVQASSSLLYQNPSQFAQSALLDRDVSMLLDGMQSWMWVALAVKGQVIGGIGMAHTQPNYFTSQHEALALIVANQAAIIIHNAELYKQAQALAILEERQNLARDLHDAINQSLFSAGLIAEVLPRLWERDQADARRSLEDLRHLVRGAQAEMRTLLAELRPSTLTDSSLGELLSLLGNALSGRTNLPVAVTVTGKYPLPAKVQVAFYRVCQEALYNITKHAKAIQVEIHLNKIGPVVELHIRDDGLGFDPDQAFPGHYGLTMMRERAEDVDAILSVVSQLGHGTELTMYWTKPLVDESDDAV